MQPLQDEPAVPSDTIEHNAPVDLVYESPNPLIRWLGGRLLRAFRDELGRVEARGDLGLDVGCGKGYMLRYFRDEGVIDRVVAIDLDHERMREALRVDPAAKYVLTDARRLPVPDLAFDYAVAAETLEHIPEPERAMEELARVVKPGGPMVLSVPYEPWFHWGNVLRGKYLDRWGRTPAHVNFWGSSDFAGFLEPWLDEVRVDTVFPWLFAVGRRRG